MNFDSSESLQTGKQSAFKKRKTSLFSKQSNGSAIPDASDRLNSTSPVPPMGSRPRRLATWADDTNEDIQQLRSIQTNEYLTMKSNKQKMIDNSDDDVTPMIPDIEEVKEYEMVQQVAEAPSAPNQIISFQELDKNLLKHSAFTSLDGIDLTVLTHFCLPESQVKEDDIPWSWDNLMSDITSKLVSDTDSSV